MAFFHRNRYPDVPEFDSTLPVAWNKQQMREAASSGEPSFLRYVAVRYPKNHDLGKVLHLADIAIDQAGEYFNIQPVRHSWGLYKRPTDPTGIDCRPIYVDKSERTILPTGYSLVAQVDTVTPTAPLSDDEEAMFSERQQQYYSGRRRDFPRDAQFLLCDIYPRQCIKGTTAESPEPTIWLVDIEPRLSERH